MKRDWDTIREILIRIESFDTATDQLVLEDFPNEDPYKISYHFNLLMDAGLIQGDKSNTNEIVKNHVAKTLTWSGHEFLDAIKNDTVWEKTKSKFKSVSSAMTFDLVKSVAINILTGYIENGGS